MCLHINAIDYHENFVANGPDFKMPRGVGTIKMVDMSLSFMLKRFSISSITFEDASNVPCKFGETTRTLSLMYAYIALHGKTWYEQKFGAIVLDSRVRAKYAELIQRLESQQFKQVTNFDVNQVQWATRDPVVADRVAVLYAEASMVRDFFKKLRAAFHEEYCSVTYRWLDMFIDDVVLEGIVSSSTKWIIPLEAVRRLDHDAVPTDVMPPESVYQESQMGGYARRERNFRMGSNTSVRYGWSWD